MKIFKKRKLFQFIFNYQRKYMWSAVGAGILLLINVLLQLPLPLVTRYIIDNIIPSRNFKVLNILCLALFGVILIHQWSEYLMRYLIIKYKAKVNLDMERDLYLHVQELPMSYFSKRSSGYILSRIGEVSTIEALMADTFLYVIKDIITLSVGGILILSFHFLLGLISLLVLPFFVLSLKTFHKKIKDINKEFQEKYAQYRGRLERNINSIEKIKSSVKEKEVGERLANRLSSAIGMRVKAQLINALASIVSGFIGMISPFVVLWFGVSEILRGNLTLGTFFAINSFLGYLYGPARRLTDVGYRISKAMAGLERIYEVFNEKIEDTDGVPVNNIEEIFFKDVTFTYNVSVPVIRNLNLRVKKGERLAIVGESGQGKSTLVKMILKFYKPDSGYIYFSGKDSRKISTKSLRKKIAYISQRPFVLEEEVNEQMGNRKAKALLEKFKMKKTFDKESIHQSELSGGEIQKIELIESILKEADVLIVDEGTSNIDYNSERIVLNEIFNKYRNKIIIFIAHRLSSVTGFERIVVIDQGRVVEEGTHHQLMKSNGKYCFFWGNQEKSPTQTKDRFC